MENIESTFYREKKCNQRHPKAPFDYKIEDSRKNNVFL